MTFIVPLQAVKKLIIKKKTMKRKNYKKPTMQVVKLRHMPQLLNTSGEKQDYIPEEWGS